MDKQCVFIKASGNSRTDRLTLLLHSSVFRQLFLSHLKNTIVNITIGRVISADFLLSDLFRSHQPSC